MKLFTMSAVMLTMAGTLYAGPGPDAVQWSANGHWYELVELTSGEDWQGAYDVAQSLGGYLVVAPDYFEREWCRNTFGEAYAVGLYQDIDDPDYSEPAGGWKWLDGTPATNDIWGVGEPDDGGGQDCADGFWAVPNASVATGFCDAARTHALVEWDFNIPPEAVQWTVADGGNGHWYLGVAAPNGISWLDANAAANGMGGHLATMTSAEEDQFVSFTICEPVNLWNWDGGVARGPWFGGYTTVENCPAGEMLWVTGELWDYTRWHPGNPNNSDCTAGIQLWGFGARDWQDNSEDDPTRANGYVVEFGVLPEFFGACCINGEAVELFENDCARILGEFMGEGSDTDQVICSSYCPSDVDGDGFVTIDDLLTLIAAWGACP